MENTVLKKIVNILKEYTLDEILEFEEKFDPQFEALKRLYEKIEESDIFITLVCLNALVCYQLNCRGEEYWWEFFNFFVSARIDRPKLLNSIIGFLRQSRCNKRLLNQKIRRIEKACVLIQHFSKKINWLIENQARVAEKLSKVLNTRKNAKTIVFTVKMLNYALRIITGKKIVAPFDVDIPLDSRIKAISESLRVKSPINFWRSVSRITNIPPLHIDSLLWVGYRIIENRKDINNPKLANLLKFVVKR